MTDLIQQATNKVTHYIEQTQSELLAFLSRYVQFKSINPDMLSDPSGTEMQQCQEWLKEELEAWNIFGEVRALGYPVLLGTSRKSFIGFTLDLPADQRVEGTAATVAVGITRGADIIRVHDVKEMERVAKMTDAIVRK